MKFIIVTSFPLLSDFEMKVPVTTRLFEIEDAIKERHGGGCGPVQLCLEDFSPPNVFKDMTKMLKEVSIATTGKYKLLYDFGAISHPLLTTTIRRDEEKVFKPPSKEEWEKMRNTNI